MNGLLQRPASAAAAPLDEADGFQEAWARGATSEARAAVDRNPSLVRHKSFVLDLVYTEICKRRTAGEDLDPLEFLDHYPAYRSSLRHRLGIDSVMGGVLRDRIPRSDGNPKTKAPTIWPAVGEPFGEYTLLRELGRGAFARVYLATEASTGDRPVVLKVSTEANPEARTLGRLAHENIVPVLSARQHASYMSVVCMPFLGSATLHDVLDRAYPTAQSPPPRHARLILDTVRAAALPGDPVPELGTPPAYLQRGTWVDAVARLGERLATALAFVHQRGILHRDLKPSNILLDAAARPLLLDFNLSADERRDDSLNGGTLPYMAPEQIRQFLAPEDAPSLRLDGRADLFALGVLLYELLTGRHPFGRISLKMKPREAAELMLDRQRAGCTPLRSFNPHVDRGLAALIESCLAFEPKDRPTGAAPFAAALQHRFAPPRGVRLAVCLAGALVLTMGGGLLAAHTQLADGSKSAPVAVSTVQEYERGRQTFDAGKFREADACFARALDDNPDDVRFLVARGRSQLALHHASTAVGFFLDALRHLPAASQSCQRAVGAVGFAADNLLRRRDEANILAGLAYSELLDGQSIHSVGNWDKAEQAGFPVTLAFSLDRANACLLGHRNEARDYKALQTELDQLVQLSPAFVPARWTRLQVALSKYTSEGGWTNNKVVLPAETLDDIRTLDRAFPQCATVHFWAAHVCAALAVAPDSPLREEGRHHLRQALLLGWNKPNLQRGTAILNRLGADDCATIMKTTNAPLGMSILPLPLEFLLPDPGLQWLDK